jgi:hypothetical protein
MRKHTRIAVVAGALLVAMAAPIFTSNRQAAQASASNPWAVVRQLESAFPRLHPLQQWRLAKVACKTSNLHDKVHEFDPVIDGLLAQTGVPAEYRYRPWVLELSRDLYDLKQDGGWVYTVGSAWFCQRADNKVKWYAGTQ